MPKHPLLQIQKLAAVLVLAGAVLAGLGAGAMTARPALAEPIRVGVSAGPHAQILEVVRGVAAERGLDIRIIEFTDYVIPNAALAAGELDANSFQHQPYLDNQVRDRGYDIVSVARTVVFPMGFYSKRYRSLEALPQAARVAIQNDPTNGGRSLLLLQSRGVLKLRDEAGLAVTIADIVENPKSLRVLELDAAQLPRSLDDVDAAAVNTNYALEAGLNPNTDAIARESTESPYANVIAVQRARAGEPWVAQLVAAYQTDPVKRFIEERFAGAVVPAW